MKKANIDELKVSDVRPGVTRRSFSGAGATLVVPSGVLHYAVAGGDYYAIDEGDPGA